MDINVLVHANSQSAEVEMNINGAFNFLHPPLPRDDPFGWVGKWWGNQVEVRIYENGWTEGSDKQIIYYRTYIKLDDTDDINSYCKFLVYPLYSATAYFIDVKLTLINTNGEEEFFTSQRFPFTTFGTQSAGIVKDRDEEMTLKEKQKNATLLHNSLVLHSPHYSLESFACLLGLADCAGELNPAKYMIYKMGKYNSLSDWSFHGNTTFIVGEFKREYVELRNGYQAITEEICIKQNGSTISDYKGYSDIGWKYVPETAPQPSLYDGIVRTVSGVYNYLSYPDVYNGIEYDEEPPTDIKKAWALGFFPIQQSSFLIENLLSGYIQGEHPAQAYDLINSQAWLAVETAVKFYRTLQNDFSNTYPLRNEDFWNLNAENRIIYQDLWSKFDTFHKFSKCRIQKIEYIAEFMCKCFEYSNGRLFNFWGTDTPVTWNYFLHYEKVLEKLYNVECVKKKARYWYNYFKKRKMPLWEYLRYTV